jgi:hypothetical protein
LRSAWGESLASDIAVMEWELGSRATNDILNENSGWGEVTIANRFDRARSTSVATLSSDDPEFYTGKLVTLLGKGEEDCIYLCHGLSDKGGIRIESLCGDDMGTMYIVGLTWVEDWAYADEEASKGGVPSVP